MSEMASSFPSPAARRGRHPTAPWRSRRRSPSRPDGGAGNIHLAHTRRGQHAHAAATAPVHPRRFRFRTGDAARGRPNHGPRLRARSAGAPPPRS
jgi:hypothetical protein